MTKEEMEKLLELLTKFHEETVQKVGGLNPRIEKIWDVICLVEEKVSGDDFELVEIQKISKEDYYKFVSRYVDKKEFPHLRFGQAFMNTFYPDLGMNVEIYYGENFYEVAERIMKKFVEKGD